MRISQWTVKALKFVSMLGFSQLLMVPAETQDQEKPIIAKNIYVSFVGRRAPAKTNIVTVSKPLAKFLFPEVPMPDIQAITTENTTLTASTSELSSIAL